ncbi:tescalcin a [Brachyhypopomus gauderio]|uniref:tescalcin a n=1 Tax=Brachyhypopomus gauderio TaxID=698409 RepID=UPI0040429AF6
MGSSQSVEGLDLQDLSEKTGFSLEQVRNLYKRFKFLSKDEDTLSKEDFKSISNLAENPIKKQIINAFFDKRNFGHNEKGSVTEISFEQFLTVMSFFRPLRHDMTEDEREKMRREKLHFLFNMHDKDGSGTITLDEYKRVVERLVCSSGTLDIETAKAIADAAMLEVTNVTMGETGPHDGINFEDFFKILKGFELGSRMHVRFLDVDTPTLNCRK